jgi:tyrosinase
MALRKNQRWLTAGEKQVYIDAVLKLKAEKIGTTPPTNTYDKYVKMHDDFRDAGHKGPAFLAWHREFLRRFELELQRIMDDKTFGLPYWDWSVDQTSPKWPFTKEFLGGNGTSDQRFPGKVMDGPFAYDDPNKWRINIFPHDDPDDRYTYLRRQFADGAPTLPTPEDVQTTLKATPYDVEPWNEHSQSGFRNLAEGWIPQAKPDPPPEEYIPKMHNRIHAYVGGSMGPPTSPNDPVFWLHHCFIDKQWADWQRLHPNADWYLPDGGAREGHNLKDPLPPWNENRPLDVLDYWNLGYHYDNDNYLMPFDVLYPTQSINSASGKYYVTYGRWPPLILSSSSYYGYWKSSEGQSPDGWCVMQPDGNLVIYDWSNPPKVIWASNTNRGRWGYLQVEDDFHLTMYDWDTMEPIDPPWRVPPPNVGNPPPYGRSNAGGASRPSRARQPETLHSSGPSEAGPGPPES